MALTAGTTEKALRRLLAMDSRWYKLLQMLNLLKAGGFVAGELAIPLSAEQVEGLAKSVGTLIAELETVLAGLEAEVRGSTEIRPGTSDTSISDPALAVETCKPLLSPDGGVDLRQSLVEDLTRNLDADRDLDGELTDKALDVGEVSRAAMVIGVRIDKAKLVLAQLRSLGA